MKLIYFGHSAFQVKVDKYKILIDPFFRGNPFFNEEKFDDIEADYILVTHGHKDHLGDSVEIAKKYDATVVANYELSSYLEKKDVKTHPMHIGGSFVFPFGKIKFTQALHGSAVMEEDIIYAGNPCGIILTDNNGKSIYHAGDTGVFLDMKLIGELNKIDYALLPIGDNFTMGIEDAVKATEMLNAKNVVPMHYNSFDVIKADPKIFKRLVKNSNVVIMNAYDEIEV